MLRRIVAAVLLCALVAPSFAVRAQQQPVRALTTPTLLQQPTAQPTPTPDPNDPIVRIKDEGMNRSQVVQTLSYLSDVIGPRLTASPNAKRANEWTLKHLSKSFSVD